MAGTKCLGKGFGAFEPGGRLAGAESPDPSRGQIIDETCHKRRLGTNHDKVDAVRLAEGYDGLVIGHIEGYRPREPLHAGIARSGKQRFEQRAFRKCGGDGMFAAAGTDQKNIHGGDRYSGAPR